MQHIEEILRKGMQDVVESLYGQTPNEKQIQINQTPEEYDGHYTLVVFPFVRLAKKKPEQVAEEIGRALTERLEEVRSFNVVKGFCNLEIDDVYWKQLLLGVRQAETYGLHPKNGQRIVVEYASPNTNKPLHLGHIRNNLLGYSVAQMLEAAGYEVKKVQIVNDRGIHICKSMLSWERFGEGETPEKGGMKGDHLVGKYYVRFEQEFQKEYADWQVSEAGQQAFEAWKSDDKARLKAEKTLEKARQRDEKKGKSVDPEKYALDRYFFKEVYKNTYFNTHSDLGQSAKEMLRKWEEGDEEVRTLWATMNQWVYDGFDATYARLGVDFDKLYYESKTYLKGRDLVRENLAQEASIFFQKEDGSTWIDLTDAKLDQKVVLRADGTSMYITQDIGTAVERYNDFEMDQMIYVVADEQEYHFKVLFETLKRMGQPYAEKLYHLSYGMVNLTSGRMKSREGTVVDADDLIQTLVDDVAKESSARETLVDLSEADQQKTWEAVALGALKFFILKVEPKKSMIFDPKQSISLQGHTGPYIQNAYVRTQSVQQKAAAFDLPDTYASYTELAPEERELLRLIEALPKRILTAAETKNPSDLASYSYDLAKLYHKFWGSVKIVDADNLAGMRFRLELSQAVAHCLRTAMGLLGIQMPRRM